MAQATLPSGWQEVEDADHEAGRYNPQPITLYEHAETSVGVRLTPDDPNTPNANEGEYRLGVLPDVANSPSDFRPLGEASDHEAALDAARDFMNAYNDRCVDGSEDLETVLADHDGETV